MLKKTCRCYFHDFFNALGLIRISLVLDEHTRTKFLFYGGSDCLNMKDGLELYIDSSVIPDFLGGPCTVSTTVVHTFGRLVSAGDC